MKIKFKMGDKVKVGKRGRKIWLLTIGKSKIGMIRSIGKGYMRTMYNVSNMSKSKMGTFYSYELTKVKG